MQESQNLTFEIHKIKTALQANLIVGNDGLNESVTGIYASDLMSDVLAYGESGSALLTGLNTIQAAISAYMAEFKAVIFIRGKKPTEDIRNFSKEKGLVILSTTADMFEACIKVANINNQLTVPLESLVTSKIDENVAKHEFIIDGKDFANAGMVSTQIKSILKSIEYDPKLVRRAAISMYESEMNVVMHAVRATVTLTASDKKIIVVINDEGKGIPNVKAAMKEGFSTATEEQRAMGFGSGMGLPNIKKNSDELDVTSNVGKGTRLEIRFHVT